MDIDEDETFVEIDIKHDAACAVVTLSDALNRIPIAKSNDIHRNLLKTALRRAVEMYGAYVDNSLSELGKTRTPLSEVTKK